MHKFESNNLPQHHLIFLLKVRRTQQVVSTWFP